MKTIFNFLFLGLILPCLVSAQVLLPGAITEDYSDHLTVFDEVKWEKISNAGAIYISHVEPEITSMEDTITDMTIGFFRGAKQIARPMLSHKEKLGIKLNTTAVKDYWIAHKGTTGGQDQDPGDTLFIVDKNTFEFVDSLWLDGWFFFTDDYGGQHQGIIDTHDHTLIEVGGELYYVIIVYHERPIAKSYFGVTSCSGDYDGFLTSVHIFDTDMQEVGRCEPWRMIVPENECYDEIHSPHINRFNRSNIEVNGNTATFHFSWRNEKGGVGQSTWTVGDPNMTMDWTFGGEFLHNETSYGDHGYSDPKATYTYEDDINYPHGSAIAKIGDTTFVATYNNNGGIAEIGDEVTGPTKHTLTKVYEANGEIFAEEVWSKLDQNLEEDPLFLACVTGISEVIKVGEGNSKDDYFWLFQEGMGRELDSLGNLIGPPLAIRFDEEMANRHPEKTFRDFDGNMIAQFDFERHHETKVDYYNNDWLPDIDTVTIESSGGLYYADGADQSIIWELNGDTITFPIASSSDLSQLEGWRPIPPFEWKVPLTMSTGVGLNGESLTKTIKVYPNPATDIVYFGQRVENVKLFTSQGRLVFVDTNIENFDVSGLSSGLYILVLDRQRNLLDVQ